MTAIVPFRRLWKAIITGSSLLLTTTAFAGSTAKVQSLYCVALNSMGSAIFRLDERQNVINSYVNNSPTPSVYTNPLFSTLSAGGRTPTNISSVSMEAPSESTMGAKVLYQMYFFGANANPGLPTQLMGMLYRTVVYGVPVSAPVATITCMIGIL